MKEPYWLTRDECLAVNEMMLSHYGGKGGVRDEHRLDAALARPRQLFAYGKPSLAELAAAYAAGIIKNQPFIDGNKRTGFMLAAGFLERKGFEFHAGEVDVVLKTLALAAGKIGQAAYAAWLKANSKRA